MLTYGERQLISGSGGSVEAYELDFRTEEKVAEFFNKVGKFDHLVITAGEGAMGLPEL
jgi:hypothetical protein